MNRQRLGNSLTAPRLLSDLLPYNNSAKLSVDDVELLKYESKNLKDMNFKENMRREQRKRELKKLQVLEKEYAHSQKLQLAKLER